jgi:hypothetical protein
VGVLLLRGLLLLLWGPLLWGPLQQRVVREQLCLCSLQTHCWP